jgi:hypothetical protein
MKEDETLNLDVPANGFINLLTTLEDGDFIDEANGAIRKLVELVKRRGGTGKLQLVITVGQLKQMENVHNIGYTFKLVEPARQRGASIMFSDRNNGLVTHKVEQGDLEFGRVEQENPPTPLHPRK